MAHAVLYKIVLNQFTRKYSGSADYYPTAIHMWVITHRLRTTGLVPRYQQNFFVSDP